MSKSQNKDIKELLKKKIETLNPSLRTWEIWEAVISAIACTFANVLEPDKDKRVKREEEFNRAVQKVGSKEAISEVLALLIDVVEEYPCEDVLGELYMKLKLGNHWTGQHFTPQNIAELMAEITTDKDEINKQIEQERSVAVSDPCCGSGVMLLAQAKKLREMGINYQSQVFYVGQDIDRVVAQMCFIQLTLNGCVGYVCVADCLENPITSDENGYLIEQPGQEFWFTPFYTLNLLKQKEAEEKKKSA